MSYVIIKVLYTGAICGKKVLHKQLITPLLHRWYQLRSKWASTGSSCRSPLNLAGLLCLLRWCLLLTWLLKPHPAPLSTYPTGLKLNENKLLVYFNPESILALSLLVSNSLNSCVKNLSKIRNSKNFPNIIRLIPLHCRYNEFCCPSLP